jgi:hypothetical protein
MSFSLPMSETSVTSSSPARIATISLQADSSQPPEPL